MSTVGELLKQAREAKGLTVQEIAEATRIKRVQIEGLEKDDYSSFPAHVYVRGSIKNYASVVKIDPQPLLDLLESGGQTTEEKDAQELSEKEKVVQEFKESKTSLDPILFKLSGKWTMLLPVIIIFAVIIAMAWGYKTWRNSQDIDPLSNLGPGYYQDTSEQNYIIPTK